MREIDGNTKNLTLSLKTKWFELTKSGEKTEDYREITPYWVKRLFLYKNVSLSEVFSTLEIQLLCHELNDCINYAGELEEEIEYVVDNYYLKFKPFTTNTMTLGYPKKGDIKRTIIFEHAGIEIRTGKQEWGAEPDKLYFVIKHGKRIEQ